MPLSDIVNVVITRQTQGVSEPGFGTLMILGSSQRFTQRIKYYSSMAEVSLDFLTSDPEYRAAQDAFSQSISPQRIAIGRRTPGDYIIRVATAMPNQSYTVTINGTNFTLANSTNPNIRSLVTFSANFVTGNSVNLSLNGTPLTAVPYAGTQDDTMDAIYTVLAAQPTIASATVNYTDRSFDIVPVLGSNANVTGNVTGGASQATVNTVTSNMPTTPLSIIYALNALIQAGSGTTGVTSVNNNNGTLSLSSVVSGDSYTVATSSNITNPTQAVVKVAQTLPNTNYHIEVNGFNFDYNSPNDVETADDVALGLVNVINLNSPVPPLSIQAAALGDGSLIIVTTNGSPFTISVSEQNLDIYKGIYSTPDEPTVDVATDLTLIESIDNDWYALACIDRDPDVVLDVAAWIESRIKIFGTASANPNIVNVAAGVDTTTLAARFKILGYSRSFVMYHQNADEDYPECAWFGRVLPLDPGSETWKFKELNGIPYSPLTSTQSKNAMDKSANTYEYIAGRGMTANGTMASGEYIDIIRGIDWLTSTIQINVFNVLLNNNKVSYTDAGIAVIEAEVRRALQRGIDQDFIAESPEPTVTVPKAADVPPNDKANRILRNVRFQATVAGAIHAVNIQGNLVL